MTIEEITGLIENYIETPIVNFQIKKELFTTGNGRKNFNQIIRNNIAAKFGVYVWVDKLTTEIVYIGMAGKIKTDGSTGDHNIQKRLLASRGKDKTSKKDIQTNDYINDFMRKYKIDTLDFFVMYSKKDEPPAYVEALLLYKYYKKKKKLPRLNNSF
jgi:hypothetical protein